MAGPNEDHTAIVSATAVDDQLVPAHLRDVPAWVQELIDFAKAHFKVTAHASVSLLLSKDESSFTMSVPIWVPRIVTFH